MKIAKWGIVWPCVFPQTPLMPGDFLNTNVLIYLLESDSNKAKRAAELLADRPIVSPF